MDQSSANRLEKVHPELKKRITKLLNNLAKKSLDVRVVQGLRTFAEQDALFAQGRTKPGKRVTNAKGGQSNHNYGLAVDMAPFKAGQPDWNNIAGFKTIGSEAKKLGLEWGGDWKKLVDMPHVQLPGLSVKECFALFQRGGIDAVFERMCEILGGASPVSLVPKKDDLIEVGDRGAEVKKLQQQLLSLSLLRENEVDGIFGNITKKAVIGFQKIAGLTADGIVGDGTKAKLKEVLG
jgi:peptidoglycan LD-endopeptidase CwlK